MTNSEGIEPPFTTTAYSINPKDKSTVEAMKNIYFRFRNENPEMKKKYDEFNELLQAL